MESQPNGFSTPPKEIPYTLRVNEPDLIKALEAQKVETSGLVESSGG